LLKFDLQRLDCPLEFGILTRCRLLLLLLVSQQN